jgi:hypothetical protein
MRLGVGLYIIPLAMIANPHLVQLIDHPWWAVAAFIQIGIGLWGLSFAFISGARLGLRMLAGLAGAAVCFGPVLLG